MNSVNPQICYEHVFTNYIEHKAGSNEYKYAFPEHFNSFTGKKEIGLRSITVKCAARNLKLQNIYYKNDKVLVNIDTSISLSSSDDMSAANDKFKEAIKTRYIEYKDEIENARITSPSTLSELGINDYIFEYNFVDNEFWIKILNKNESTLYFPVADSYMNSDFQSVLEVEDLLFVNIAKLQCGDMTRSAFDSYNSAHPNVIIKFVSDAVNETKIKGIGFKNVWNRNALFITSTLSTLTEDKFFTLSNVTHNPLKFYDVNGYSQSFSIFIFDANKKKNVEIPNDQRDLLLVEMLIYGYN